MEATYSSETSVDFQRNTQRYIPEDSTLDNHRSKNLKSWNFLVFTPRLHGFREAQQRERSVSEQNLQESVNECVKVTAAYFNVKIQLSGVAKFVYKCFFLNI
jgi:hypothetical protein